MAPAGHAYRIGFISALGLLLTGETARAEEPRETPALSATLQCDRAVEPGRVRCTVEARAATGTTLQWADVVLVALPDFTQALKGRLGPADSISRDPTSERWAFGLVARKPGEGQAKVRIRAVVCTGDQCAPFTVDATALVRVG